MGHSGSSQTLIRRQDLREHQPKKIPATEYDAFHRREESGRIIRLDYHRSL
jgi:hypothetical protein